MPQIPEPPDVARLEQLHAAVAAEGTHVDVEGLVASAASALRLQAFESALAILDAALVIDPGHAEAWALRGHALERLGQAAPAIAAYERSLSIDDQDPVTALALASLYVAEGDRERAQALLTWLVLQEGDLGPDLLPRAKLLLEGLNPRSNP